MTNSISDIAETEKEDALRRHIAKLFGELDRTLEEKGISKKAQDTAREQLSEIIAAEVMIRLTDKFSKEDMQALMQKKEADLQEALSKLTSKLSNEDRMHILAEATEIALKDYTAAIRA